MNPRVRFRVLRGELAIPEVTTSTISPARAAARVVQAAQALAAAVLDTNALEMIDLSTEAGKVFLAFLDSVDEYEYRSAGFMPNTQDPAALW